jgi:beta-lactam-binding protein with PASTA domain
MTSIGGLVRRVLPWGITALAILVAAALAVRPYVGRVPSPVLNLRETRNRLEARGLRVSAARLEGGGRPLDADVVVDEQPRPGSLFLAGMVVTVKTQPALDSVPMPDLVGRFDEDARQLLDQLGLQTTLDTGTGVVVSQEPSAGAIVPFGAVVRYRAIFPHTISGLATEAVAVHGVMYLRYGIEGATRCQPCHDATSCTASRCHAGGAFRYLESVTPSAH